MTLTCPVLALVREMAGATESTLTVVLGPVRTLEFPTLSENAAAATLMATVPKPEQPLTLTVGVVVVPLVTDFVEQVTPPVVVRVILVPLILTLEVPEIVSPNVTV